MWLNMAAVHQLAVALPQNIAPATARVAVSLIIHIMIKLIMLNCNGQKYHKLDSPNENTLLVSGRLILGLLGILGRMQRSLWWRGEKILCLLFILHCPQTQTRSRRCNVAQNGGITSACSSSASENRPCNTQNCRKFHHTYHDKIIFKLDCNRLRLD